MRQKHFIILFPHRSTFPFLSFYSKGAGFGLGLSPVCGIAVDGHGEGSHAEAERHAGSGDGCVHVHGKDDSIHRHIRNVLWQSHTKKGTFTNSNLTSLLGNVVCHGVTLRL